MTNIHPLCANISVSEIEFPNFTVRGGLLLGRDQAVIWDSLSHPNDMQPLLPLMSGRKIIVIYSHADWDHIWGTAAFPRDNLTVIGHRLCLQRFGEDVPVTLRERQQAEPGIWEAVQLIPPDLVFENDYCLDLGDFFLELHALPGHTADSIVGFASRHGVLLAGDTVECPLPCVPPDCPIDLWISGLERWLNEPRLQIVVPAHGRIGGKELIADTIGYLQSLLNGGTPSELSALPDFYRQTHLENIRNMTTAR